MHADWLDFKASCASARSLATTRSSPFVLARRSWLADISDLTSASSVPAFADDLSTDAFRSRKLWSASASVARTFSSCSAALPLMSSMTMITVLLFEPGLSFPGASFAAPSSSCNIAVSRSGGSVLRISAASMTAPRPTKTGFRPLLLKLCCARDVPPPSAALLSAAMARVSMSAASTSLLSDAWNSFSSSLRTAVASFSFWSFCASWSVISWIFARASSTSVEASWAVACSMSLLVWRAFTSRASLEAESTQYSL
mmetsp:Transcript_47125/g.127122  ORF Transcript_47125/g.127122 Transcript_47125/m.127122 type:complete len:256 (-) Transcript_47125:249-1016(-)